MREKANRVIARPEYPANIKNSVGILSPQPRRVAYAIGQASKAALFRNLVSHVGFFEANDVDFTRENVNRSEEA